MPSSNGHAPKRAILYARVSTQEQAEHGYSLRQQMERLREYARAEGYEVLEEVTPPWRRGRPQPLGSYKLSGAGQARSRGWSAIGML